MFAFVSGIRGLLRAIVSSLRGTLSDLVGALQSRSGSKIAALLSEGSPLESLVDSALTLVFWVLVLSPFLLFPLVYLLMSVMR